MNKLLVNAPSGAPEVIEVGEGGGYFDASRVLWDERTDGPMPAFKPTPKPAYNRATQGLDESAMTVNGEWVQAWTVRAATADELAQFALEQRNAEDESAREAAKLDATIRFLVTHTDAEIVAKVNTDGATLAGLRAIVGKLAVAVGALARKELRAD